MTPDHSSQFGCTRALCIVAGIIVLSASSAPDARAQSSAASPSTLQSGGRQAPPSLGGFELTAAQKTKLDSIGSKHSAEARVVSDLFATDPAEAMRRMVALRTKMQKEVRVVLTSEQRAIFDRNIAEMNAQLDAHLPSAPR